MNKVKFSDIIFDHASHTYKLNGVELISVTTLLSKLKPSFDSDFVSKQVALKNNKTQDQILEEWRVKGEIARDKGTRVHTFIEDVLQNVIDPILYNVNDILPEMVAFRKFWEKFATQFKAKVLKQELTIGDPEFGIAGKVDLITTIEINNKQLVTIIDWKTGKVRSNNPYEYLLPPFNNLENCELEIYSLQTSLYRLILEKHLQLPMTDSYLVHLQPDGNYHILRAKDYRARLAEWLKNGIPPNLMGDPASTAKLESLIESLGVCDYKLLSRVKSTTIEKFAATLLTIQHNIYKIINQD